MITNHANNAVTLLGVVIVVALIFSLILRNRKKEIVLLLISLILSISIAEVFLRLFYPQIHEARELFEYDAHLG